MELPLNAAEGTPASMEAPAIRALSILSALAWVEMLEGSVRHMTVSVLPALATMQPCTRRESIAMPASVSLGTKVGTVAWKWMNAFLIPA